ncbi:uncharacterized protein LOC105426429 [Pogonomyrmex barbatus]|uniref:Uncharacterized protein LOC105426429 n=1 Tax=Pogonomyrmex barbatus TaxID=144034 RepID=A0A6I9W3P5_9HYME|nr:uncharacterized protein LOC105426429 [Pogonomyrmex barbatus]
MAGRCSRNATYTRFNKGYHYILTIIDVLSKHAWAVPLKTKSGDEVARAIEKIIRDDGRCPKNLQTDREKEFYNANVQKVIKRHDINHYSTYSVMKASIVERFNHTLKNDIWKMFTHNGNYRWLDLLSRLVLVYNTHRTIGMRPINVIPAIADKLLTTVYNHIKIAASARFKVGDSIHVENQSLEDSTNTNCHRVVNPNVYLVEKVLGKRGNEVYVKWLGFDNSHNSWIHKSNVL